MALYCHGKVVGIVFALVLMHMCSETLSSRAGRTKRVIGGSYVAPGEIPYQVFLTYNGDLVCGGSILTPVIILTAAHCVTYQNTTEILSLERLQVVAGAHDTANLNSSGSYQSRRVKYVYLHDGFSIVTDGWVVNDIALIVLSSPLHFSKNVQSILLPSANEEFEGSATVSGWGATKEEGKPVSDLRKVSVDIVPNFECEGWHSDLGYQITDSMICAGKATLDTCTGDSGGPATCTRKNQFGFKSRVQCGIVSQGFGCSRDKFPGIYTKVSKYIDWIETTTYAVFARDNKCRTDHIHCPSHGCIHRTHLCDFHHECPDDDGKDELGCNSINIPLSYCLSHQFRCNNGKCIESSERCNVYDDCDDGSDEDKCPPENNKCEEGEYQCGIDGRCIPEKWRCDGELDCDDNSDEEFCSVSLLPQKFANMDVLAKSEEVARYRAREKAVAFMRQEEITEMRTISSGTGSSSGYSWWTRHKLPENIYDTRCRNWYRHEPSPPTDALACPPTLTQAKEDWRFSKDAITIIPFVSQELYPDGYTIYLQVVPSPSGAGSHCSYDKDGDLVIGYPHGSRTHRVSPNSRLGSHYWDDVQPYSECCVLSYNKKENCRQYYFAKRPSSNIASPYFSPIPFRATGATQVTTLNGKTYLLGTPGTYSLLKFGNKLEVKVSTEPFRGASAKYVCTVITSATLISKTDTKNVSTFRVSVDTTNGLLVRLDDEPLNFFDTNNGGVSVSGPNYNYSKESITIFNEGVTAIINGTSEALFTYSSGFSFKVLLSEGNMSLNIIGSSPNASFNNLTGLVSNFGGNDKNETRHVAFSAEPISSLDHSSREFAEQWKVPDIQLSLRGKLNYRPYSSTFHFNREYLISTAPDKAKTICGNGQEDCIVDYLLTGNKEFATSSITAFNQFVRLLNASQMNTVPITCEYPGPLRNGKYLADNFNLGANITPTCNSNYYLHLSRERNMLH